jgi:hypothetical protein
MPPGDFRIAVSQRLWERAGDLAQQEQPVKNGIPQYPVFVPLGTADAIQVLADGPRGVSKVGDVQMCPFTGFWLDGWPGGGCLGFWRVASRADGWFSGWSATPIAWKSASYAGCRDCHPGHRRAHG